MTETLLALNDKTDTSNIFHSKVAEFSPHVYEGFAKLPKKDNNWIDIDLETNSTNDKSIFQLTLEQHMYGRCYLTFDQSLLTPAPAAPGDYNRFVDYFPYEEIDRIELWYLNHKIQEIPSARFFIRNHIIRDDKAQQKEQFLVFGNKSIIERNLLARATQQVRLFLPLYFGLHPSLYLPAWVLEKPPRIYIYWKQNQDFVQSNMAGPFVTSRNNIKLHIETVFLSPSVKDHIQSHVVSSQGYQYYYRDLIRQEGTVWTSTDNVPFQVELDHFTHESIALVTYIRRRNQVQTGPATFRGHENLLPWQDYQIKSGAKILRDIIPYWQSIYEDNEKHLNSPIGVNILIVYFTDNITDEFGIYGSKPIGAIVTPRLNINPDLGAGNFPLPGDDLLLDTYALTHNIVSLRVQPDGTGRNTVKWETLII